MQLLSRALTIYYLQMDNSPTTGSVSTTVAEKEKLAKASLAFNCKKWVDCEFLAVVLYLYNCLELVSIVQDLLHERWICYFTVYFPLLRFY